MYYNWQELPSELPVMGFPCPKGFNVTRGKAGWDWLPVYLILMNTQALVWEDSPTLHGGLEYSVVWGIGLH